jgi:UDP-GlcNAc:undecaprenyl-phosphate/decaprenyl-phosphate GlcNAc-1-phosphate transferase
VLDELNALIAFLVALAASAALTPVVKRLASRAGIVDEPRERGLSDRPVPLLGGIAILAGVVLAAVVELPDTSATRAILGGAAVITVVGALDDRYDLPAGVKLLGQIAAALIPVLNGVVVTDFTLPFVGHVDLGDAAKPLTLVGLVFLMNVVNFSDGVDGLAAGVCTISALAFAIIAFDLGQNAAAVLAALTAGASLGFLFYNFNPASIFMGDSGANLLGYLLGCVAVQGTLKTNAVIALVFPLVLLAVPFVDTTFVVLKRLKYRKPVYTADRWHLHHRMANIGFSQRRTVLYLYAWTLIMAGLGVALRFVPYSDDHGHLHAGWTVLMGVLGLIALAASVYLVYVLEIVKFRRLRSFQLRRVDPDTSEHQIEVEVQRELETGEFEAVDNRASWPHSSNSPPKATSEPSPTSPSSPRSS